MCMNIKSMFACVYLSADSNTGSSMTRALMMILPSFRRFVDQPVPDPAPWSVDDVVSFITDIGFPEESLIFKEQVR